MSQEQYYGGVSWGCILAALVRFRLPCECGLMGGGAHGMFEGYKALLGDKSLVYCGSLLGIMSQGIVGNSFGCSKEY